MTGTSEEGSLNIVMLLLTGRATPYLHNGVIYVGDEDHYVRIFPCEFLKNIKRRPIFKKDGESELLLKYRKKYEFSIFQALPQFGILARSAIGLLILEGESHASTLLSRQPGSRLKTPALPVWVTSCCGHYGVMFNSNRELLRNYHAEKRFELYYYTCAGNNLQITVDNRSQDDQDPLNLLGAGPSSMNPPREESAISPITRLIHTKWADAKVTFKGSPTQMLF